ncbi:hypothetical protein PHYSODRAFT_246104 [Phytophthora sojae]|uniref:Uncharacterized protein n=1 Tax=Phytophthora sojae (strain P6497) TaxID=1094619 RepID=G4ZUQ2_PHYSP|nr:hypothetical protein PHYSODRAFT_246104 [Phytophthora sojae]EGZ13526.1 hypothetical protein PHYSODRAFT_246104 [Phytophthora sojae]|eukprot:XP_009530955.1 hypothetical protein PHYSODRAFT_246104 [Phytophthora sojae]
MTAKRGDMRGGRGRGEVSRQSRRAAGTTRNRAWKRVNAEKRKAALAGDGSSNQVQPAPEQAVPNDAHQVSKDGEPERADAGEESKTAGGDPGLGEPNQASEGDADVDEPQAEGRVSDSPLPGQDVQPDAQVSAEPKPTPSAEEEKPAAVPAKAVAPAADAQPETQLSVKASRGNQPTELSAGHPSVQAAKTYAALQASRWERARSGLTLPPNVEYAWPESRPDSVLWLTATLATSKYLASKVASQDPAEVWLADLAPSRRDLSTAQDLAGVQIPTGLLDSRECVAVLQTLLFEAGFQFVNVMPALVEMRVSKLEPMSIRTVVGGVQGLLAVELIEWRELVVGATFKILPALEAQAKTEKPPIMDYHTEDADGDLLMNDYELLLGRTYVLCLRLTGLRPIRSPSGSSPGEPAHKRLQHAPPRAESSLASPPSQFESLPSEFPSAEESARDAPARGATSDPVPSIVGTSDRASYGATSESYVSRNTTSDPSTSTLGYSAASHFPLPQLGSLAMSARGPVGVSVGAGDVGFYVTREVVPKREPTPDQADANLARLDEVASRATSRTRTATRSRTHRRSRRDSLSSGSDSDGDARRRRRRSTRRSSRDRSPSRRSSRSRRSYRSTRSGRTSLSAQSGMAEMAVSTFHQVQQLGAEPSKLREAVSTGKDPSRDAEAELALAEAQREAREAERRAQELERHLHEVYAQASQMSKLEAARAKRERVEAAAAEYIHRQLAEADARHAAEMAARAGQAQQDLAALAARLQASEVARAQERAQTGQKNTTEAGWEQLLATLPEVDVRASSKDSEADRVNAAHRSTTVTQVAPTGTSRPGTKTTVKKEPMESKRGKDERRKDERRKDNRKKAPRKGRRRDRDSSPDSSSSSSSSDDDSSSADDSLDDEDATPTVESTTVGDGKTSWTLRPYVNSSTLGQFDEKAPLGDRHTWWEKFTNISVQGGWFDQTEVRELKMKLSPAARNWCGQLEKHVQSNWKRFVQEFRKGHLHYF